jgi:hypothetical protein
MHGRFELSAFEKVAERIDQTRTPRGPHTSRRRTLRSSHCSVRIPPVRERIVVFWNDRRNEDDTLPSANSEGRSRVASPRDHNDCLATEYVACPPCLFFANCAK